MGWGLDGGAPCAPRCARGSVRVTEPARSPSSWLLQSSGRGVPAGAQWDCWARMHQPPQRGEPRMLEAPQGLVLPCPCLWKAVTAPEPGLGTPRSCLAASKAENIALISLICVLCAVRIWDSPQMLQVPVPQRPSWAWLLGRKPEACQAADCCRASFLPSFFP